ncbi:MAG: DNA polymerase I [Gemmatimonadetes bacterium]|nr:DNA polymerase I [Gemmatimonadota bacterium]
MRFARIGVVFHFCVPPGTPVDCGLDRRCHTRSDRRTSTTPSSVQAPEKTRPRLYLIDGYALIYRAFFAMIARPLISSRGENTSAAWGVAKFLLKIIEQHEPDYLGVVFDAGTSERHEIYPEYKATREKMPSELESAIPRLRELIEAFHIPILELAGYEADDVIGTLAEKAVEEDVETVIVSGDKDFYQLLRDGVCLLNPGRGGPAAVDEEWVDLHNAHERLGVAPERVVDYLALIGDTSDNVPGVRGIGPKTAIRLIEQFGPIETILENVENISAKRPREALTSEPDRALLSKRLVTIRTDLPVPLDLDALVRREPDRERLKGIFLDLEFHSLVRDHAAPATAPPSERPISYKLLQRPEQVADLVGRIRDADRFSIDTETSSTDAVRADLIGISLSIQPGEAYYLPFGHTAGKREEAGGRSSDAPGSLFHEGEDGDEAGSDSIRHSPAQPVLNLPPLLSPEMEPLVALLEDASVPKLGQNLKYDLLVLRRAGVELRGIGFDTMIASYLLNPGGREHGLDALALKHLDHRTITYGDVAGKGKSQIPFAEVPLEPARDYACEDADLVLRLAGIFEPEIERLGLADLLHRIEIPLIHVLAEMEWAGIRIDEPFFGELRERLRGELRAIEQDIYREAGTEFNINSNPQLREILFDKLELPVIKRTKTGPSTDVTVLEELASRGHTLPSLLMQYRQLDKLQSTYVEALPRMVNPETGRLHTSFNQTIASTGRLSSSDPNLQNIPIRRDLGAEIRRGFTPAEGQVFVSADYSQIELRILAHYSEDPAFLEAFRTGEDIHRQTAALIFGVERDAVTREMRDRAKTVNFAVIYGIGPFSLAQRLGISNAEAKEFIDRYFERFPGVRRYLDEQIQRAREQGYVETLTGRRRYIPEITSRNFNIRSFGERAATNAPIQGSSADLIKIAMIEIHRDMQEGRLNARMLLQVHDELLFEVPRGGAEDALAQIRGRMESAAELRVPLRVETGTGKNWLECK